MFISWYLAKTNDFEIDDLNFQYRLDLSLRVLSINSFPSVNGQKNTTLKKKILDRLVVAMEDYQATLPIWLRVRILLTSWMLNPSKKRLELV